MKARLKISALNERKLVERIRKKVDGVHSDPAGFGLCQKLGHLPFWCGNDSLHLEKPDVYHDEFCCLTHVVGLPRHGATGDPMPLTPYQVDFFRVVLRAVKHTPKKFKRKYNGAVKTLKQKMPNLFHLNKGRQMGFTELILRILQYFSFSRYAGRNVAIMAATNGMLAKKNLRRLARLYINIPKTIQHWISGNVFRLVNGTAFEAFKASEEALTGDTNYAAVFMDEAAKWSLVDDTPVFNSVMPIVRTNASDLFLVSTPKGPVKTFYKIHKNPGKFIKVRYDIWHASDNLYTKPQIEEMLNTTAEDPNQEYLTKFTISEDSIFGEFDEMAKRKGLKEWQILDEDDSYVEPEDAVDVEDVDWGQ